MVEEPRIKTTQDRFIAAYVRLARDGAGKKLTVAALCREAKISRYTFYAHYLDLEDFLQKADQQIIETFLSISNVYQYDTNNAPMNDLLFHYFFEQAETIFTVLEREGGPGFSTVIELFKEKTVPIWQQESGLPREQVELLHAYSIYGTFEFLRQWWKSGFQVDIETAKILYENVGKYGIYNYVYTV